MSQRQIDKELQEQVILFEDKCLKGHTTTCMKFQDLAEQWLKEYAELYLRDTSYERMLDLRARVYEALSHMWVDKITTRHVQQFVNDLLISGKHMITGQRLSRKTVVHLLSFISAVLGYAQKLEMIADNPCSRVTVPKGVKKEKNIYTIEEVEQILDLLENEPLMYKVFFTLAIYSGFRRGELLGLKWKDVDWEHCVISVRRTSCYTPSKGMYTDTTKTVKSQRSLKFPAEVIALLKEFKEQQDISKEEIGSKCVESDRIFIKWNGEPLFVSQPYNWFKRFCKKYDMRFCDTHSLRHFYASALISEGVDAATVSIALGHSTITTTTSIYCHAFDQAQARAGDAIASVLDFKQHKQDSQSKEQGKNKAV